MIKTAWLRKFHSAANFKAAYRIIRDEFDTDYYVNRYDDVRRSKADPRLHYLKYGWKEARDPTPWFSTDLYLRNNSDVRNAGINPFVHYIKFGRAEGRPTPTLDSSAYQEMLLIPPSAMSEGLALNGTFDLKRYEQHTARTFSSLAEAIEDVIKRSYVPLEALGGDAESSASFLAELGDQCRLRGLHGNAEHLYSQALEHNPAHFQTLQHLGDIRLDRRNFAAAAKLYRSAEAKNPGYLWTQINLAKSLFELDRYDDAIRHARIAHQLSDGSSTTTALWETLAHAWGNRLIQRGIAAAQEGNLSRSRQYMNEAIAVGTTRERPAAGWQAWRNPVKKLRVAILADDVLPQCVLYRVTNKIHQLDKAGIAADWLPKGRIRDFASAAAFADVLIFYRVPGTPEIVDTIRHMRALGKPTYYEIDDLIFSSEHYPEPYDSYAGLVSRDQYAGLAAGAELFRLAMRECDFGIASTEPLAEYMRKEVITGDVIVVPNSLGPSHIRQQSAAQARKRGRKGRKVHIFYGSGTLAHKRYFDAFAEEVLAPILARNRNVVLTLMGTFPTLPALTRLASQVKVKKPDWNYENYLAELSKADISIAPLPSTPFNDCKSEIKWLEAAIFAIPSVLSDTATHALTVQNGKSGFLCSSRDQWIETLQRLIDDASLRDDIGKAAKQVIDTQYNAATMGEELARQLTRRIEVKSVEKHKLRVAVVNVFYPPQAVGGATRVVHENVDSLQRRYGDDIEVTVFTTTDANIPAYAVNEYDYNGVRVTAVRLNDKTRFEWRATDDRMKPLFARYLEFYRPDIVHFHCIQRLTGSIVEATRDAGIPYVVTVHDGWWLSDHQFLVDALGRVHVGRQLTVEGMREAGAALVSIERTVYLRKLLADAAAVIGVSAPFAGIYESVGLNNVVVAENGTIVLDQVKRSDDAGDKVRIGFIGGLATHKGFDLIGKIWAANKFENIELVLVDHSQPEFKKRRVLWNENPVTILGRVRQSQIRTLYASIDVLLAPSIWPESFGLVTREAAQAGLWVVASDRGSIGDIIEDGVNGFHIDVSDVTHLEAVLKSIDKSPEKFKRRTGYVARFATFDGQVDRVMEIYKSVLQETKSASFAAKEKTTAPGSRLAS